MTLQVLWFFFSRGISEFSFLLRGVRQFLSHPPPPYQSHQLTMLIFDFCPSLRIHEFYCSASIARDEFPKEAAPLQPLKEDPHLEFLTAAFFGCSFWSTGEGVWQSCLCCSWQSPLETATEGGKEQSMRGWLTQQGRRRFGSAQCGSLYVKAVVRKKMKLFREASHLWLLFRARQSKTYFLQCVCARVRNSHEFGSEKIFPL